MLQKFHAWLDPNNWLPLGLAIVLVQIPMLNWLGLAMLLYWMLDSQVLTHRLVFAMMLALLLSASLALAIDEWTPVFTFLLAGFGALAMWYRVSFATMTLWLSTATIALMLAMEFTGILNRDIADAWTQSKVFKPNTRFVLESLGFTEARTDFFAGQVDSGAKVSEIYAGLSMIIALSSLMLCRIFLSLRNGCHSLLIEAQNWQISVPALVMWAIVVPFIALLLSPDVDIVLIIYGTGMTFTLWSSLYLVGFHRWYRGLVRLAYWALIVILFLASVLTGNPSYIVVLAALPLLLQAGFNIPGKLYNQKLWRDHFAARKI